MMLQRVMTALIVGPIFLAAVLYHPLLARCVFAGLALFSLWELRQALQKLELEILPLPLALYVCACFFWPDRNATQLLFFLTIYSGALLSWAFWSYPKISPAQIGINVLAALYPVFPLLYAADLRVGVHGQEAISLALFLTWAYDTSAYFGGTLLGRHYLFPALSPKKSAEGVCAGLLGTVIVGMVFVSFWPIFTLGQIVFVAAVAGVFAQIGDLVESMLKRFCGVKDSGDLLPGHGGILDRFDAFFFVVVWVYAMVQLWG